MTTALALAAEPPKALTGHEECALLERALAVRKTRALKLKLARLYNRLDRFGEAIDLLGGSDQPDDFDTAKIVWTALMGRGSDSDIAAAGALAANASRLARCDVERAEALIDQAAATQRLGNLAEAEALLETAHGLDPANDEAVRRLSGLWLGRKSPERVIALTEELEARGIFHSQLLGLRTKALAQLGRFDAARELVGLDRFLFQTTFEPPQGWPDLPSFNHALTQELLANPGLRNGRHGTASVESLRVDEPATAATPAMRALQSEIVRQAAMWSDNLPRAGHPWLRMRPTQARVRMWCVITGSSGRERWHMHPLGWATGGYYVAVPEAVGHSEGPGGCLEFGLPEHRIGREAAAGFGSRLVRPHPGLLNLFPSHAHHRTHPHGAEGMRICIAFDLIAD